MHSLITKNHLDQPRIHLYVASKQPYLRVHIALLSQMKYRLRHKFTILPITVGMLRLLTLDLETAPTHARSSRCCACARESQRLRIPPRGGWVKSPNASVLPAKDMVDNVRHKERHRGKVVHSALEGSICSSEDERCDAILISY
jgi:hypothetical protein